MDSPSAVSWRRRSFEEVSWKVGRARLEAVRKRRARPDAEEAAWRVACGRFGAHRELGYATSIAHAATVCG